MSESPPSRALARNFSTLLEVTRSRWNIGYRMAASVRIEAFKGRRWAPATSFKRHCGEPVARTAGDCYAPRSRQIPSGSSFCNRTHRARVELYEANSFRHQERREGSDPMTARQPGKGRQGAKVSPETGTMWRTTAQPTAPSSNSLQHRTPIGGFYWALAQLSV